MPAHPSFEVCDERHAAFLPHGKTFLAGSTDTAHGRGVGLEVVVPAPVAEALTPGKAVVVLRGRPVPTEGRQTGGVETTDGGAVVVEHVQLVLRRQAPVRMAVCFQGGTVFSTLVPIVMADRRDGRRIYGFARVR